MICFIADDKRLDEWIGFERLRGLIVRDATAVIHAALAKKDTGAGIDSDDSGAEKSRAGRKRSRKSIGAGGASGQASARAAAKAPFSRRKRPRGEESAQPSSGAGGDNTAPSSSGSAEAAGSGASSASREHEEEDEDAAVVVLVAVSVPKPKLFEAATSGSSLVPHTEGLDPASEALETQHEALTKVRNIRCIELGRWEVDTWYFAPYPDEFAGDKLYLCEFTLKYFASKEMLERHKRRIDMRQPPGLEIYRDGKLSMYEIDGKEQRLYC